MWNRPQLMKDIADLLFMAGAAVLLVALAIGVERLPLFPVREVVVTNELREVRRAEIERALSGMLRGNFFGVGLDAIRQSLEHLPWVRRAGVRRIWPARIEIVIEEHVPVAFLGQDTGRLLNSHGEIFIAGIGVPPPEPLPILIGPTGFVPEMLACFHQAAALLRPHGRVPRVLHASPRLALRITLDDGMIVELGRRQTKAPVEERLRRFAGFYPSILTAAGRRPEVVDMRYPMGFALRVAAAREDEG
jgi:cell division protein FtsQ